MKRIVFVASWIVVLSVAANLAAQEPPPGGGTQEEHALLKNFVGQWNSEAEATASPDGEAITCSGSAKSRMLGDLWVVTEMKASMMGVEFTAVQTIGYDPQKKKYVGTWVDSMMNHMWHYEGTVDETGKILTLEAEGPSMLAPGKTAKYRDSYEFKSADHIVATSSMNTDGKWVTFMTGNMRREK